MVHRLPNLSRAGRDAAPRGLGEARPSGTESRRHGARGIAERRSRAPNGCETRRNAGLGFLISPSERRSAFSRLRRGWHPCTAARKLRRVCCRVAAASKRARGHKRGGAYHTFRNAMYLMSACCAALGTRSFLLDTLETISLTFPC